MAESNEAVVEKGDDSSENFSLRDVGDSDSEDDIILPTTSQESMCVEKKSFSELGLNQWICNQLQYLALNTPTPVQVHCIPEVLAGRDVLGCAKTGTGKTFAFALPIVHTLALDPYGICALVLTPTRELAAQIADQFTALGASIGLRTCLIVGGRDRVGQGIDLFRRPHVVVATPGRLADHLESDSYNTVKLFDKLKYLVLDEADRLLDGQYSPELKTILSSLPKKRQTLLFSATITSAISRLHQVSLKKPYYYQDVKDITTVENLEQSYVLCPLAVKDAFLVFVVKTFLGRHPESLILIFSHTCHECQAVALMFNGLGFKVVSLHSQISQQQRASALTKFRSGIVRLLICTDVAARGLDIPKVDLVVNHNVPRSPKTYIHRVGRSARAGRFGRALIFVTQYEVELLQEIEKTIGKQFDKLSVSDRKVTQYVTQVLVSKREAEIKLEQQNFGERKLINRRKELLMAGMDEDEVDAIITKQRGKIKFDGKRRHDALEKAIEKRSTKRRVKKSEYKKVID